MPCSAITSLKTHGFNQNAVKTLPIQKKVSKIKNFYHLNKKKTIDSRPMIARIQARRMQATKMEIIVNPNPSFIREVPKNIREKIQEKERETTKGLLGYATPIITHNRDPLGNILSPKNSNVPYVRINSTFCTNACQDKLS